MRQTASGDVTSDELTNQLKTFRDAREEAKAKILKAWGPVIDKEADALIEAMGAKWEAMIAQVKAAEACNDFKGKIRDLWLQEKK